MFEHYCYHLVGHPCVLPQARAQIIVGNLNTSMRYVSQWILSPDHRRLVRTGKWHKTCTPEHRRWENKQANEKASRSWSVQSNHFCLCLYFILLKWVFFFSDFVYIALTQWFQTIESDFVFSHQIFISQFHRNALVVACFTTLITLVKMSFLDMARRLSEVNKG